MGYSSFVSSFFKQIARFNEIVVKGHLLHIWLLKHWHWCWLHIFIQWIGDFFLNTDSAVNFKFSWFIQKFKFTSCWWHPLEVFSLYVLAAANICSQFWQPTRVKIGYQMVINTFAQNLMWICQISEFCRSRFFWPFVLILG